MGWQVTFTYPFFKYFSGADYQSFIKDDNLKLALYVKELSKLQSLLHKKYIERVHILLTLIYA